jgi:flagellar assembly protein FliH
VADLPIDKTLVESVVKDALAKAEKDAEIVVLLHPDDLNLLTQGDSELLDDSQSTDKVLFKPSSDVTRGGCLLDTHYGLLDARRETKAKLLKQAVTA